MASIRSIFLTLMCQLAFFGHAHADQWGSIVLAHCYKLDAFNFQEHFFIRVFRTELGGGQFYSDIPGEGDPYSLRSLTENAATCLVNGKKVRFETLNYRAPTIRGYCGLCEQTGFRITVEGIVVWDTQRPDSRGEPIFNGTIDMDKEMLRVCQEFSPEALGVDIPFEQDFFTARTNILICKTLAY